MTARRWHPAASTVVSVLVSVTVLGPLLGPGLVQRYDMVWSPFPRWTPFVMGVGTPAPRVVPSDAAAVLLGRVVGPDSAQAIILLACLTALGWGSTALLQELRPGSGTAARCATAVIAVWNPFVGERLAVGQWTVLVGAAAVPVLLRAALRVRRGSSGFTSLVPGLAAAAAAGSNALVVALPPVLLALLCPRPRWGQASAVVGLTALLSGAWLIPSLVARPSTDVGSIDAFRPVADSGLGRIGSLLAGGGFWNPVTHFPERQGSLLVAAVGALIMVLGVVLLVALRQPDTGHGPVVLAAVTSLVVVVLSVSPALDHAWRGLVTGVPGGALLRDPQKLLAVWVVAGAVGVGAGVDALTSRPGRAEAGRVLGVVAALVPLSLLPSMAWGLSGALEPARVPVEYLAAIDALEGLAGDRPVGLLPWSQYRRYPWNSDRVSLTLGPRVLSAQVLFDDSLPLRDRRVPGEDPRAARVGVVVAAGGDVGAALRREGVRYALVERSTGQPVDAPALGTVLFDGRYATVVDLGSPSPPTDPATAALVVGWAATALGVFVACVAPLVGPVRARAAGLLQFRA